MALDIKVRQNRIQSCLQVKKAEIVHLNLLETENASDQTCSCLLRVFLTSVEIMVGISLTLKTKRGARKAGVLVKQKGGQRVSPCSRRVRCGWGRHPPPPTNTKTKTVKDQTFTCVRTALAWRYKNNIKGLMSIFRSITGIRCTLRACQSHSGSGQASVLGFSSQLHRSTEFRLRFL